MATSTQDTKKRLALAIIDFLTTSLTDGTLPPDDRESIEVASSCISDAFKVDPTDKSAAADALGPGQSLLSIYTVYEKMRGKTTTGSSAAAPSTTTTSTTPTANTTSSLDAAKKAEAEALKAKGNAALAQKDHTAAISAYTAALSIDPSNAVYLSNRAAAYSAAGQHESARQDAEMAVAADPKYTKAWSRLGLARFALGDARGSMEAYKSGMEAEGGGGGEAMRKGYETAKRRLEESEGEEQERDVGGGAGAGAGMPDLASLASMFGGGGAGGGGGMPDLAGLMSNPMMRQMAQNVMQNPDMMNNLMSNPALRNMASQFTGGRGGADGATAGGGGGGGMPDLAALMQDPSIAAMARNLMGGAGRGGGSQ